MSRGSLLAGLGGLLLAGAPVLGWTAAEAMPHGATRPLAEGARERAGLQLVQEKGIHGQDAMSDRGQGPTGWVQAPIPRGQGVSRTPPGRSQAAQGAPGKGGGAPRMPAGQDPGTPVAKSLPGPADVNPAMPAK